jgi:hypothetical protein
MKKSKHNFSNFHKIKTKLDSIYFYWNQTYWNTQLYSFSVSVSAPMNLFTFKYPRNVIHYIDVQQNFHLDQLPEIPWSFTNRLVCPFDSNFPFLEF